MPPQEELVHGWVSTNCGRGTIDILWTCLFTIFICVWTALHLSVPTYHNRWPLSLRQKLFRSKIIPAAMCIIAPELLVLCAVEQMLGARAWMKFVTGVAGMKMSLTQAFFFRSGGIYLKSSGGVHHRLCIQDLETAVAVADPSRHINPGSDESMTLIERSLGEENDNAGTLQALKNSGDVRCNNSRNSESGIHFSPVARPAQENVIETSPSVPQWLGQLMQISEDQINELAKTDTLSKLIACIQILWFIAHIGSRLRQRLAVTLLEVTTTALVACAIGAYAAWWKKPQGCSLPIIILCDDKEFAALASKPSYVESFGWIDSERVFLEADDCGRLDELLTHWSIAAFCALFGAIHVASWEIFLPSTPEQWMWRSSALFCMSAGALVSIVLDRSEHSDPTWPRRLITVLIATYAIMRLCMIVEVFLSLRTLPRSTYDSVRWTSFIPHI